MHTHLVDIQGKRHNPNPLLPLARRKCGPASSQSPVKHWERGRKFLPAQRRTYLQISEPLARGGGGGSGSGESAEFLTVKARKNKNRRSSVPMNTHSVVSSTARPENTWKVPTIPGVRFK